MIARLFFSIWNYDWNLYTSLSEHYIFLVFCKKILLMKTILIIWLVLAGIVFVFSVLMMSPKGGLGMGIGGTSGVGWGDYGSKKSLESKLKIIATISAIMFVLVSLFLPYVQ